MPARCTPLSVLIMRATVRGYTRRALTLVNYRPFFRPVKLCRRALLQMQVIRVEHTGLFEPVEIVNRADAAIDAEQAIGADLLNAAIDVHRRKPGRVGDLGLRDRKI